jgi:hypothetical protein
MSIHIAAPGGVLMAIWIDMRGCGVPGLDGVRGYDPIMADLPVPGLFEPDEMGAAPPRRDISTAYRSVALFGSPVLGEPLELPTRSDVPTPLPDRVSSFDVTALRDLTRQLESVARAYGGGTETLTPVVVHAERLLPIPGAEAVKRDLIVSIAELHTVAGWAAFHAHLDDTARYHFARAMSLGGDADDGYVFSKAAYLAGVAMAERGHFNDGLEMLQLAQIRLGTSPHEPRTQELSSWVGADSAATLARMGEPDAARSALAAARASWQAPHADDQADMDWVTGLVELYLSRLDVAHRLVTSAVWHWKGTTDRRQAVLGDITLATLHVQAGESSGAPLAHRAIVSVAELSSIRARERLTTLVAALETRPTSGNRDLAVLAQRVVAQQA